jgi:ABC-type dipeptide/oligopeptide/nickel transport system permease component
VVGTLIFLGIRVLPGDPAIAVLGPQATQQAVEALRTRWRLDEPLSKQYIDFWTKLLSGNWGRSYLTSIPIAEMLARGLPYTLVLTAFNLSLGALIGVPLGIFVALHAGSSLDKVGRIISLLGLSMPTFYFGLLLLFLFGIKLNLLPIIGGGSWHDPADLLAHLVLPGVAGGLFLAAYFTRLTRSGFLEVLGEDYVRTARSKGLTEQVVNFKHVLRNLAVSLMTFLGIYAVIMLTANILVELVFTRPGLGSIVVKAIMGRDYMVLQSVMIVYAVFIVGINLAVDIFNVFIDPTIRYN